MLHGRRGHGRHKAVRLPVQGHHHRALRHETALGIGQLGVDLDRVRPALRRVVHDGHPAFCPVVRTVGKPYPYPPQRTQFPFGTEDSLHVAYAQAKAHTHRIRPDQRHQRAGRGGHIIPGREGRDPDTPGHGRHYPGVAQVILGRHKVGLRRQQFTISHLLRPFGAFQHITADGLLFEQAAIAGQIGPGIGVLRLVLHDLAPGILHRGLVAHRIDAVEHLAGLDRIAIAKTHFQDLARHPRHQRYRGRRDHPTGIAAALGVLYGKDFPHFHHRRRYRHARPRHGRPDKGDGTQEQQQGQQEGSSHLPAPCACAARSFLPSSRAMARTRSKVALSSADTSRSRWSRMPLILS